jgi:hypothetical protein
MAEDAECSPRRNRFRNSCHASKKLVAVTKAWAHKLDPEIINENMPDVHILMFKSKHRLDLGTDQSVLSNQTFGLYRLQG